MKNLLTACLIVSTFIMLCLAPPVEKGMKQANDELHNTEGMSKKDAQDTEYHRYLNQILNELQQDPEFKKILENATEDELKSGKIIEKLDVVGHNIRKKLDEIKRIEVDYQHDLIRQKKLHMTEKERNNWNPIHIVNKQTFEKEDLKKLIAKHHTLLEELDKQRRKEFKQYEMEKEHKRRQKMKNMTLPEKEEYIKKYNESHHKKHEKMHQPGHKAQLEETWEKDDHLDPENFDEKTLFKLHDKDGDGYLDQYELETLFLSELDKVYNESDPDTDIQERDEELERMREHMMSSTDHDKDGMVSFEEFMAEKSDPDYDKDEEWKPITDEDQYTDEEMEEYEKKHPDDESHDDGHGGGPPDEKHDDQQNGEKHDTANDHHEEKHDTGNRHEEKHDNIAAHHA